MTANSVGVAPGAVLLLLLLPLLIETSVMSAARCRFTVRLAKEWSGPPGPWYFCNVMLTCGDEKESRVNCAQPNFRTKANK
jgi:hypothetical protein